MNFISYTNHDKLRKERERTTPSYILLDEVGHFPRIYGKTLYIKKILYLNWSKLEFVIRVINGIGFKAKNEKCFFFFSERNNLRKSIKLFNWRFFYLKPYKKL